MGWSLVFAGGMDVQSCHRIRRPEWLGVVIFFASSLEVSSLVYAGEVYLVLPAWKSSYLILCVARRTWPSAAYPSSVVLLEGSSLGAWCAWPSAALSSSAARLEVSSLALSAEAFLVLAAWTSLYSMASSYLTVGWARCLWPSSALLPSAALLGGSSLALLAEAFLALAAWTSPYLMASSYLLAWVARCS